MASRSGYFLVMLTENIPHKLLFITMATKHEGEAKSTISINQRNEMIITEHTAQGSIKC